MPFLASDIDLTTPMKSEIQTEESKTAFTGINFYGTNNAKRVDRATISQTQDLCNYEEEKSPISWAYGDVKYNNEFAIRDTGFTFEMQKGRGKAEETIWVQNVYTTNGSDQDVDPGITHYGDWSLPSSKKLPGDCKW